MDLSHDDVVIVWTSKSDTLDTTCETLLTCYRVSNHNQFGLKHCQHETDLNANV